MNKEEVLHIAVDAMPATDPSWVDYLSALLVPAIAVIGICIAYQQYRINKQRLRHETYERRLSVYKCVQRYLSEILRDGKTTFDRAVQFNSDASEAAFLFDDSVQNKIDDIYKKSLDMAAAREEMYPDDGSPGLPVGEERKQISEKHSQLLGWHITQLKESRQFFAKKLGLKIK